MAERITRWMDCNPEHRAVPCRPCRWILVLSLLPTLLVFGCAKTGDPHPPLPLLPRPAADLAAVQLGEEIVLTVTPPKDNTDGSEIRHRGRVELLRRIEPGRGAAHRAGPEAFEGGATVVQTAPPEQADDYEKDGKMVFRDHLNLPDGAAYRDSLRYAVRFFNKKGKSAGISNQVLLAPIPMPVPLRNVTAEVSQDWIRLSWSVPDRNADGSAPPRIAGYNIYRSTDPRREPATPLGTEPLAAPPFEDRSFEFGKTYYYWISIVGSRANPSAESLRSAPVMVRPRDTFPPGMPEGVQVVAAGDAVLLLWVAPPQRDIAGYRIYRSEGSEPPQPLSAELVKVFSFRDEQARHGRKYAYRITAVDIAGNEGPAATVAFDFP